jgi:cysteine synthase A
MSVPASPLLGAIGNTPLVPLRRLAPAGSARVLVKLESVNPSGSAKDRMALSMIEAAERDGRLQPGHRLVEASGGSSGTALAMITAIKGYACTIVSSDAFADEKLMTMRAFGATVDIVPSAHGKATYPELFVAMRARVEALAREPGAVFLDQNRNPDNAAAYRHMADEIAAQVEGPVDAFAMACGSGGCFSGTMEGLRARYPGVRGIGVEPAAYRHLSGGPRGVHHIDGVGDGPPGPLFRMDLVDEIEAVTDQEAYAMARRLAREEGILGGKSAAANVTAALRVAARLGRGHTVVSVICDSGYKYFSGDLFR